MSRLFRQIGRGFQTFGRQLSRDVDTFGRQTVNTTRQIGQGLEQGRKVLSDVEKGVKSIPVVGAVVGKAAGTLGDALRVGQSLNSAAGSAGTGLRQAAGGDLNAAVGSFGQAGTNLSSAVNDASNLATNVFV